MPEILGNPRAAASIETLLQGEGGVHRVFANPVTGRVLVEYVPGELKDSVEILLHRALEFGPMSGAEFDTIGKPQASAMPALGMIASAELGCLLLKLLFFGVGCPGLGAAAALAGLAAVSFSLGRANSVFPMPALTERIESAETRAIGNHKDRAQVV